MPPEISTTRRPTAKIRLTELVFSRLNKLAKVRKCVLLSDSATDIPRSNSPSQASVGWSRSSFGGRRSGIYSSLEVFEADLPGSYSRTIRPSAICSTRSALKYTSGTSSEISRIASPVRANRWMISKIGQ